MLLQSYDFLVQYDRYGCTLQMGGSDQWGNIVAGTELIRKMRGAKAYGLVFPLVTSSAGVKFGKTEAGSVWLDPKLTSPYRFYQFWINTEDSDVVKYLKYFTMLDQQAIAELEQEVITAPEKRVAQKRLAEEVTLMVHGAENLRKAIQASQVLFGGEVEDLSASDVLDIFAEVPSSELSSDTIAGDGIALVDLVISSGLASSKGAARRLIEEGGIYINNRRVSDTQVIIDHSAFIDGQFLVLRRGARKYHLVRAK
jgi:tyrosyl-tRNA synthetase